MKKLALVLLASLLLAQLLVAPPSQAAAPFSSPLPALTDTYNLTVPTNIYVSIPCALGGQGEDVYLSGDLHVVLHFTLDASGSGYHVDEHYQPQGITGVGMTSGVKYQATGVTRSSENFRALPYSYTFVNNFRLIGAGPGNNYLLHETFHLTINANGELTAVADNYGVDCK